MLHLYIRHVIEVDLLSTVSGPDSPPLSAAARYGLGLKLIGLT